MDGLVAELLPGAREEMAVVAEHGGAVEAVDVHEGGAGRLPPRADQADRDRRAGRGRQNRFTRDRALAADRRRRRRRSWWSTRRSRPQQIERLRALARRARPGRRRRRARRAAPRRRRGAAENMMAADDRRRAGRRHDRRVGADAARGVRRVPRADRRRRGRRRGRRGDARRAARRGRARCRSARAPAEDPGRQAGARRPLQRRRADRRARPRRGHGRRLRGHPPDARADRRLGRAGGRARHRPVDPVGLAPRADPRRARRAARGRRATRRWSSAASSPSQDVAPLREAGVAAVYTPKDFDITRIMRDIVELVASADGSDAAATALEAPPARRERRRSRARQRACASAT